MADFDFDAWSNLARRSPAAFFRARERAIDRMIAAHPPAQADRLREFQGQIDSVRALAGSPIKATRELVGMIEDRLEAMRARVSTLRRTADELDALRQRLITPPPDDTDHG
ncbi:DUF3135 domain-containing protein [Denitromonas sp.]|uniref:DUF3135 domain-containing protein n=1 Tax=Denitromonas sp. TaxID=2734609 RepID=UPI0035442619